MNAILIRSVRTASTTCTLGITTRLRACNVADVWPESQFVAERRTKVRPHLPGIPGSLRYGNENGSEYNCELPRMLFIAPSLG